MTKPNSMVDPEMLRLAQSDAKIARLCRTALGLDRSETGQLFCDEAECHDRLRRGELPDTLTAAQYARISRGFAAGDFDDDADPGLTIQATRPYLESAGSDPYAKHPLYREYVGLSPEIKQALRNDFRIFLEVKKRGQLDGIANAIYEELARDCERGAQAAQARQFERALEAARDSPEFKELMARRNAKPHQQSRG